MSRGSIQPGPPADEASKASEARSSRLSRLRSLQVRFPDEYAWFVLVSSMDLMFTWLILNLGGREANPIANSIYMALGFNGLVLLKYGVVILVIAICELIARLREPTARTLARVAVVISAFPSFWAMLLLVQFVIQHS
ncbi:DUF5658 family protein [Mucisphaera sp.]|uniref:DUF5658 family protein n=1 Tax=Mucisphaera sp. TaxID=2913024 RepID=UPI003D14D1A1